MSWKLEGSYFETCSCDVVCPCTASLAFGATHDRCKVTLVFNVKRGEVDGVDVSGLTVAAVADTPKVMSEGNWRLGVFIDGSASDEQTEKLGAVCSGSIGGPMEALGPLIGEQLGVERAAIEVQEDGLRHSVRIGDAVDFEIEDVDCAIRYGAGDYPGLFSEQILGETVFPVCSPTLTANGGPPATPQYLARFTLLHDDSPDQDPSRPDWTTL